MSSTMSITAVIPAYNAARFLADALESVRSQTYPCAECIVIDDGSTDDTPDIARSFDGVRLIRKSNGGVASARNLGIEEATGDLVAFLDADDIWLPTKIEKQLHKFEGDPSLGLVYSGMQVVDETLEYIDTLFPAPASVALRNTLVLEKPYMTGIGSTGLVPRAIAREIGFDPRLAPSADWAFACRLGLKYPVDAIPESLVLYRQHSGSQMHLNLRAVESDYRSVWAELSASGELPRSLARHRRRAHANLALSLAAGYFKRNDRVRFLRYLGTAFLLRPDRVVGAFWRRYRPVESQGLTARPQAVRAEADS